MLVMKNGKGKGKGGDGGASGSGLDLDAFLSFLANGMEQGGKGTEKGWEKGGKGYEKGGKYKGPCSKGKQKHSHSSFSADQKIWVGGLSNTTTWAMLKDHFTQVSGVRPASVDVNDAKGTGVVCYRTEDEVHTAVAAANGSELDGSCILVNFWERPSEEQRLERKMKKKENLKREAEKLGCPIHKMREHKKPKSEVSQKLKTVDPSLKVWVGGLQEGTTFGDLTWHFTKHFAKPILVDFLPSGDKAVVTYKTTDDVANAVATMNGSELNGSFIQVQFWSQGKKVVQE